MFLLLLTGLARSGKDTAARYISEKYGFVWLDMSRDALEPEIKRRNMARTKENLSLCGDILRKEHGMAIVAQRIADIIRQKSIHNAVISGLRSPEETQYFKKLAEPEGKCILLKITAETEKRRMRADAKIDERDLNDIRSKGFGKVLEMSDYAIENNSTIDAFYSKIDGFIAVSVQGKKP